MEEVGRTDGLNGKFPPIAAAPAAPPDVHTLIQPGSIQLPSIAHPIIAMLQQLSVIIYEKKFIWTEPNWLVLPLASKACRACGYL